MLIWGWEIFITGKSLQTGLQDKNKLSLENSLKILNRIYFAGFWIFYQMNLCSEPVCACLLTSGFWHMTCWKILFAGWAYLTPGLRLLSQPALLHEAQRSTAECVGISPRKITALSALKDLRIASRFCVPSGGMQSECRSALSLSEQEHWQEIGGG